jgi:phosphatidyl-myo-inositol dimannoside synthase
MDDRHKGHHVALRALAELKSRVPDVRWTMVGDGVLRPALEEEARRLGLVDSVVFTGAVTDAELDRQLSAAHAFCLLSQEPPAGAAGEGFGIVLIEAGARGLPVVAGDVPGVRDAVKAGTTGVLVPAADPGSAATALSNLLTDPELAGRLGEAGRARARELAWPSVAARYREVIRGVLDEQRRDQPSADLAWMGDLRRGPLARG